MLLLLIAVLFLLFLFSCGDLSPRSVKVNDSASACLPLPQEEKNKLQINYEKVQDENEQQFRLDELRSGLSLYCHSISAKPELLVLLGYWRSCVANVVLAASGIAAAASEALS